MHPGQLCVSTRGSRWIEILERIGEPKGKAEKERGKREREREKERERGSVSSELEILSRAHDNRHVDDDIFLASSK